MQVTVHCVFVEGVVPIVPTSLGFTEAEEPVLFIELLFASVIVQPKLVPEGNELAVVTERLNASFRFVRA